MYLAQQVRNKLRALLQAYGTKRIKSYLWNAEFSKGRWDCLNGTPEDCLYPYLEKYANRGSILDLGCGSGSTGNELAATTYREYTGVDISDVAIEKARTRTEDDGRTDKNRYIQSDIFSYEPSLRFDVILFRDSIYYVPRAKITGMLDRYSKFLKQGGVFIVRMWSGSGKYKAIVETIETNFEVVEKRISDQSETMVIVFRQRFPIHSSQTHPSSVDLG